MKGISALFFASFLTIISYSQTNIPQLVSFSAVVRDVNNQPLVDTPVSIRLTFKQGGQAGPIVYCALHQTTTNQNGFMSLQLNREVLGTGCNGAPSTAFQDIPWENGGFWMEVEYQTVPGLPFVNLGQLELASSFYAFAAGTAERIAGFDLSGANDGDVLTYNALSQQWEANPPSVTQPVLNDDDPTNEIQQLSVSATGDTLRLQNGGFVIIPGLSVANNTGGSGVITSTPGAGVTSNGWTYSSVVLGNGQEWMAEKLRTSTYANGDLIPNVTDGGQWGVLTTGAWSHYNNDNQYEYPYGKLYNWYTTTDPRNVCPAGWHVPSLTEYTLLIDYLGGDAVAGGKMKEVGTVNWPIANFGATDESGFSGLPGGIRNINGTFQDLGLTGIYWSASELTWSNAARKDLLYWDITVVNNAENKKAGSSVRCLRN